MSGEVDLWYGEDLRHHEIARAGDYIYIPAGVSHVAVNRSQTEPMIAIGAHRSSEQESVVLQPELEVKVLSASRNGHGAARARPITHLSRQTRHAYPVVNVDRINAC